MTTNEIITPALERIGHIYRIRNTVTEKHYIGQAMSHRKNKGKYVPFGYEGRLRDHISEAVCNTKKKQCRYLNNAIRLYGKDVFHVELLKTCPLDEMDMWEIHYIQEYNTYYPNGYNLTKGGKTIVKADADTVDALQTRTPQKRGGCVCRTESTRGLISKGIKTALDSESVRQELMKRSQQQHRTRKVDELRGVTIDKDNLDQYLSVKHRAGQPYVIVKVDGKTVSFVGKYETLEILQERAREFLRSVS